MDGDEAAGVPGTSRRLFVAVQIPSRANDVIDPAIASWGAAPAAVRWTPSENRHITIRFLGAVAPEVVGPVVAISRAAGSVPRFSLSLGRTGQFPPRGLARVLWIGLDDPDGGLSALATALGVALPPSVDRDPHRFHPHLTVARVQPATRAEAWARIDIPTFTWSVDALLLVESHLGRPHTRYEIIARAPLAGR